MEDLGSQGRGQAQLECAPVGPTARSVAASSVATAAVGRSSTAPTVPGSDRAKPAGPGQDTVARGGKAEPGLTTSAARPMGGVICGSTMTVARSVARRSFPSLACVAGVMSFARATPGEHRPVCSLCADSRCNSTLFQPHMFDCSVHATRRCSAPPVMKVTMSGDATTLRTASWALFFSCDRASRCDRPGPEMKMTDLAPSRFQALRSGLLLSGPRFDLSFLRGPLRAARPWITS